MAKKKGVEIEEGRLESYQLEVNGVSVNIDIERKKGEYVDLYIVSILNISRTTSLILNKIRDEFISKVNIGEIELSETASGEAIKEKFKKEIDILVKKYFPKITEKTTDMLINYIMQQYVGFGNLDILLKDAKLEEIVINSSKDPVWVYHRKHGWLKTNVIIENEARIRHFSTVIGREVGKDITLLTPLMDAHLRTGDRVNATLSPISTNGNTITIRKFSEKPWTITDFIKAGTISYDSAAFVWLAVENELSTLIAGGTGSGKTSMLNVVANFFPPNQRIISIEDTREITLPKSLHWVPLETRMPNPEGKGGVSMLDLVINSLRMRPDRIIVGEIRRQKEAEVLFEAMQTGHSVYATIHANNAEETITRLTNPPIDVPKLVVPALSLILVQNRNRRTNLRRTLQLAEIKTDGNPNVFMQLDAQRDIMRKVKEPARLYDQLNLYTGMNTKEINADLKEKVAMLKDFVKKDITDINKLGLIFADYYTQRK